MRKLLILLILLMFTTSGVQAQSAWKYRVMLPAVNNVSAVPAPARWINVPYFANAFDLSTNINQTAIFWFGKVATDDAYADVRIGYNDTELFIRAQMFDRRLWYDPNPSSSPFEDWDAFAVTVNTDKTPLSLSPNSFRFIGELYDWEGSANYHKAYQGNGTGWVEKPLNFSEDSSWRGPGGSVNGDINSDGWVITFHIPFNTLGMPGKPVNGTTWRLGLTLYDRNYSSGPSIAPKTWPENANSQNPASWGGLRFGLPVYTPPGALNVQTTTIRNDTNGPVQNAMVGGDTVCGGSLDKWTQWGNANYWGYQYFNVQNQADVADWPCFSKFYVTFPISSIPAGKVIKGARLRLNEFGGSTAPAYDSLIQVSSVKEDWNVSAITWNNAPYAYENVAQTWVSVYPYPNYIWPGEFIDWDVGYAVSQAYKNHQPVRFALYSADTPMNSGKYFRTSEVNNDAAAQRPTLMIDWGDPN